MPKYIVFLLFSCATWSTVTLATPCSGTNLLFGKLSRENGLQQKIVLKKIPDLDFDNQEELIATNLSHCGATGNCPYQLQLSNKGCPKDGGDFSGSSFFILPGKEKGLKKIGRYWKGGCTGIAGTWSEAAFNGKEYTSVKKVKCECEITKDRSKDCPPWKDGRKNIGSLPSIYIRTLPVFKKVKEEKVTLENEELGKYEVHRLRTLGIPADSMTVKNETTKKWAGFLLAHIKAKGLVGDDTSWYEGWSNFQFGELEKDYHYESAGAFKDHEHTFAMVHFLVEMTAIKSGRKRNFHVPITGIIAVDDKLNAVSPKNIFYGAKSDGELRRYVWPRFLADVDENGYLDIVLVDTRYAGEFQKVLYLDKTSYKKPILKSKEFHSSSWD